MSRVCEYDPPQRRAIDLAVREQGNIGKRGTDRGKAGLARSGQPMRKLIGVDDLDAQSAERVRHCRLAAADAASEANDISHGQPGR